MAKIPGLDQILSAADLISDIRKAFTRIEGLEKSQKDVSDALLRLDARVRELEAGLREAKSEIKLEAVKEAQGIVNSVQSSLYSELKDLSVKIHGIENGSLVLGVNSGNGGGGELPPPEK